MAYLEEICVFCESKTFHSKTRRSSIYKDQKYRFLKCSNCRNLQLSPMPNTLTLSEIYSYDYTLKNVPADLLSEERIAITDKDLIAFLNSFKKAKSIPKFLDFGCGENPITLRLASEFGFESFGYEYDTEVSRRAAINSNRIVFTGNDLDGLKFKFDCIFLGDVLEHLTNPLQSLEALKSLLSESGYIVLQGPLEGSQTLTHAIVQAYGFINSKKISYMPPYHVTLSNKKSVIGLFEKLGFEIESLRVSEVRWPTKNFFASLRTWRAREIVLSSAKLMDFCLAFLIRGYGNRFFLVAANRPTKIDSI
jgi:2-polyprenyl-3-methyl-5-hydroxy-6-metoxy-1,4-benzoquinol methylase